jgi:hypothetical protein
VRQLQFVVIAFTLSTNANTIRQENKMSTEQETDLAIETLKQAIQALIDCGLMAEGNEDE